MPNKNNKKNQKNAPKKKTGQKAQMPAHCSDYCKLLCNPRSQPSVGIPTLPAPPTSKLKVFARGSVVTSDDTSEHRGFLSLNPGNFVTSNGCGVVHTDAACIGAIGTALGVGGTTTGVNCTNGDSPYASASFGAAEDGLLEWRLVAAEIKLLPSDSAEDVRGLAYTTRNRFTYNSDSQSETYADYINSAEVGTVPIRAGQWVKINYLPIGDHPEEFWGNYSGTAGAACDSLMILLDTAGSNRYFFWEVTAHYEITGRSHPGATKTKPAPGVFEAIEVGVAAAAGVAAEWTGMTKLMPAVTGALESALAAAAEIGPLALL